MTQIDQRAINRNGSTARGLYGSPIYWLETAGRGSQSRQLEAGAEYEVVIVGGGFTGLWTAYHLLKRNPSAKIALLEREELGFGASGRNGGFAMPLLNRSLHHLLRDQGAEAALAVHEAAVGSVKGIARAVAEEGIDCEFDYGGLLTVATNESQERKIRRDLKAAEHLDIRNVRPLSGEELRARIDSPSYRIGTFEDDCAVLHPAKLVRGLSEVLTARGLSLFEQVEVTGLTPSHTNVTVETSQGTILADSVVMALSAWASHWTPFARDVAPVYTYVLLTEPIDEDLWARVGWQGREGVEDKRIHLHFYRRTRDGRILWGGRENIQSFAAKIGPRRDRDERVFRLLEQTFRTTFPQLSKVHFTHGWGGPVDITPSFMPSFGSLGDAPIHYGHGYCGHGVGPSYMGGEILADLAMGRSTDMTKLCVVEPPKARWPLEPIRFLGGYVTRRETVWFDEAGEGGKNSNDEPVMLRLVNRLLAPRFTRPKGGA